MAHGLPTQITHLALMTGNLAEEQYAHVCQWQRKPSAPAKVTGCNATRKMPTVQALQTALRDFTDLSWRQLSEGGHIRTITQKGK